MKGVQWILLVAVGLLSCSTLERPSVSPGRQVAAQDTYQKGQYDPHIEAHIPEQQKLSFEHVIKILKEEKIEKIETLLVRLKKQFPLYLQFHTLMYDSRSLQESSFVEPRAIVFGPEGRFIFTFNGGPAQRGGAALETMTYEKSTGRFLFREVLFKAENGSLPSQVQKDDIEFEDSRILITKSNPQKCQVCHGQPARPIWEPYHFWPGAFGSNDDSLTQSLIVPGETKEGYFIEGDGKGVVSQNRLLKLKDRRLDPEVAGFKEFLKGKRRHPRFSSLPERMGDVLFREHMSGTSLKKLKAGARFISEISRFRTLLWPARPNLYLNTVLYNRIQDSLLLRMEREDVIPRMKALKLDYKERFGDGIALFVFLEQSVSEWSSSFATVMTSRLGRSMQEFRKHLVQFRAGALAHLCFDMDRMVQQFSSDPTGNLYLEDHEDKPFPWNNQTSIELTNRINPSLPNLLTALDQDVIKKGNCRTLLPLVLNLEVDSFEMAYLSFLFEHFGISLRDYAPNLHRQPTFNDGGFERIIKAIE